MMGASRELAELASSYNSGGLSNMRNRIINGDMRIDQRNAGASVTPGSGSTYVIDRFRYTTNQASKITWQRSTTTATGFINSLSATVASAFSSASTDFFGVEQLIEGFNVADLGWGTANAQPITLSFFVRSSLTGTYALRFTNDAANRSYVATFTITAANTFEQKTISIVGDTTGTWLTNNGAGVAVWFDLGSGSNFNGTAGSWAAGNFTRTSGSVNWVANAGATFFITGVQLEKGSTATSFDVRPYGTELALCQRYLPAWNTSATNGPFAMGQAYSTTAANIILPYQVQPRVPPTGITSTAASSFYLVNNSGGVAGTYSATNFYFASLNALWLTCNTSAGLVAGNATLLGTNNAPAQILATGCEL